MFNQLLVPVDGNLVLSFAAAALPIATVLVALGILRRPAWQASLAGLIVGLVDRRVRAGSFRPGSRSIASRRARICALAGHVDRVQRVAALQHRGGLRPLRRVSRLAAGCICRTIGAIVLVVIGFCFGCLLEGIAGFGTPVAITSALLILVGLPALEALTFTLIFNTAPVAFGALGTPITVLGAGHRPARRQARRHGRTPAAIHRAASCRFMSWESTADCVRCARCGRCCWWPAAALRWRSSLSSNYLDYSLTDVLAALVSLLVTLVFLRLWTPAPDPQYAIQRPSRERTRRALRGGARRGRAGCPGSSSRRWSSSGRSSRSPPSGSRPFIGRDCTSRVHHALHKPYAANWVFQPLGTGTAILVAAIITAGAGRRGAGAFLRRDRRRPGGRAASPS